MKSHYLIKYINILNTNYTKFKNININIKTKNLINELIKLRIEKH